VRPGEKITAFASCLSPQGRIRGQVQVVGGALPDGWRLQATPADRRPLTNLVGRQGAVSIEGAGGYAFVDEKGRFVIEGLPAANTICLLLPSGNRMEAGSRSICRIESACHRQRDG